MENKSEPWVNFTDKNQDRDMAIFLRPDGLERVHIYIRPNGTFGLCNFFRSNPEAADAWEVGPTSGHHYDSIHRAIAEAVAYFPWLLKIMTPSVSV